MNASIRLSDFDYSLPKNFIAQNPCEQRDKSRLLVLDRKSGTITHKNFVDLIDYPDVPDTLVLNDTKVLPARLFGRRKTGGTVEIFLLNHKGDGRFECLLRPARLKAGESVTIINNGGLSAVIKSCSEVEFDTPDLEKIYGPGTMPLPPYIKRGPKPQDIIRYQTVYARSEGSVAAHTAGLHFTEGILQRIQSKGVRIVYLTVHIGYGTFRPIKCEDVSKHRMDEEHFLIPLETLKALQQAKKSGRRIIAVGTSTTRALETINLNDVFNAPLRGKTNIFIYPGYKFKAVDCLLTNFHLARTAPFMMVCGFAGKDLILKAYAQAQEKKYRFLSFGDSMFIM